MGHERVGALPRTERWNNLVEVLAESSGTSADAAVLADNTLKNVRSQFGRLAFDDGVVAAFQFLIALAKSSSAPVAGTAPFGPQLQLAPDTSILSLVSQLHSWVKAQDGSREYADLATKAAADAIVLWASDQSTQPSLFADGINTTEIWNRADNASGFCELARLFFARFTRRYLGYFLDREASNQVTNIDSRDQLATELSQHVDRVSTFAFETSRITQSFAAGWFNNHARDSIPTKEESRGFLRVAFGKLREELWREANLHG